MNRTSAVAEDVPDLELLVTWVAVVEAQSVSVAAQRLAVSQAAVSQRVKLLEGALGIELLDRTTRPAQPTSAGQWLFESASKLLVQARETVEGVRQFNRVKRSVVRFGCVDSFAGTLGPDLIRGLSGQSRQILFWSGLTPMLDEQLENRGVDLAVTTRASSSRAAIRKRAMFAEPYLLVLPKGASLVGVQSLSDLAARLPFIRYSARSVIGQDIDRYVEAAGESIERSFELDNTDPLLSLVSAGFGFALTTPLCLWQSRHFIEKIRTFPLSSLPRTARSSKSIATRTFYLSYRERELGRLPAEAANVIGLAAKKLFSRDIAPALGLRAEDLYRPGRVSALA